MLPLLLVGMACGDDDDAGTADTVGEASPNPVLTWDGTTCVHDGPAEASDGVVVVELVNESDGFANLSVVKLDEGRTAADMEDLIEGPDTGAVPTWITLLGAGAPASAGEMLTWEGILDAGEYALLCERRNDVWFGGGLTVVEG